MADTKVDMINELKSARRGRGLPDAQFANRYGAGLLTVLGMPSDAPVPEVRRATIDLLERLTSQLPSDVAQAVLVAFGVHQDARQRFYDDRMEWLASTVKRDKRTMKRLVDSAIEQLADLAMEELWRRDGRSGSAEWSAWHCERLDTVVVLDGPGPEIVESRRIRCNRDRLSQIDLAITLTGASCEPRHDVAGSADLEVDVLFGGTLVCRTAESSTRVGLFLELPAPLEAGEHAEFMVRYRIPPGKVLRPHYVAVPRYRCDVYRLHVRFGARHPVAAYRLAGVFQLDIEDPSGIGELVPVDAAGELDLRFDDLRTGFAYGARWEPPEPAR